MSVNDALSRYLEAATGITQLTKSRAEQIVKGLIKQGEAATRNPQELVEQLLERSQENREALAMLARSETKKVIKAMGLATRSDVERLQRQLADLRREASEGGGRPPAGERPGTKKAARKPAEKAAKKTAKRATEKGAKKTTKKTAKKATKKTAKKATKKTAKKSSKKASS